MMMTIAINAPAIATDQPVFLKHWAYRLIWNIRLIYQIYGFCVHNVLNMI